MTGVSIVETDALQQMTGAVSNLLGRIEQLDAENKKLAGDRVMSMDQAMEYTGIGRTKLGEYKAEIGFIQIGCGPIKFRKSQIDAFLEKHTHQSKFKK